jgi:hypothetical protein
MENLTSPLQKYKRQPKLYIDLPSKGVWYNDNIVEKFEELEVYSMTASNEILAKTPDALITGNATVKVIESCVPAIKNAWKLASVDFEYVMAAIRLATYGENITMSTKCTSCTHDDTYGLPVQSILDHFMKTKLSFDVSVDDFVFRLRPLTYKEIIQNQQVSMKVRRELMQITQNKDMSQDDKDKAMDVLYEQINTQTKSIICQVVVDVTTPDGDIENNSEFINDFILNNDGVYFNEIQKVYAKNTAALEPPITEVVCSECQATNKIKANLDFSSFFLKY